MTVAYATSHFQNAKLSDNPEIKAVKITLRHTNNQNINKSPE